MANDNLRRVLRDADIQPDELAGILEVDERTIRRWLAGGVPYARHRARLARALDTTEPQLWPDLADANAAAAVSASDPVDALAGDADATGAPITENLIDSAGEHIDLLADTSRELLAAPGLTDKLLAKAGEGCRVRILVCEPDHESLAPLLLTSGLEIRRSEIRERPTVHRADDQAVVWISLSTDQDDERPMLLHIRADQAPGLFARLADHYQDAWDIAEPVQTADDVEYYLTERDGDYDNTADPIPDRDSRPLPPTADPAAAQTPDRPDAEAAATPARRWPGRQM